MNSHSIQVLFYTFCKASHHLSTLMSRRYCQKYSSSSTLLQANISCLLYYFNNELMSGRIRRQDTNSSPGILIIHLKDLIIDLLGQGLMVTEDGISVMAGSAHQIEPYVLHNVYLPIYDLATDRVLEDQLCSFSLLVQFFLLGMQNVIDALLAKNDRSCVSILIGPTK